MKLKYFLNHIAAIIKHFVLKTHVLQQIPETEVIERQRFVVFRIFSLVANIVSLGAFLKMFLTLKEIGIVPYFIPLLWLIITINYLQVTKRAQLNKAYLIMLLSCVALLHLVSYSCGGIETAGTFFFLAIVIYSFMLLGNKGGMVITGLVVAHAVYLFLISTYTDWTSFDMFSNDKNLIREDFLLNILLSLLLIASLSHYLQSNRNVVIQGIIKSKNILELQNEALKRNYIVMSRQYTELEKFASVASHDLRAPIRAIGSLADMLIEDTAEQITEGAKSNLLRIKSRAERLDKLLQALLKYSKADKKKYNSSQFNPKELIDEIISQFNLSDKQHFTTHFNFDEINSYKEKLNEIFSELILNSLQFNNQDNLKIEVRGIERDTEYLFSVIDNGIGIAPKFHEKIFIIFQTLNARDEVDTPGVGLAIVKKIVEDQGGKIGINSSEGAGTEIWFTWPKIKEPSSIEDTILELNSHNAAPAKQAV